MPLQKLQFRPGVNREGTTLANEGGWFECDKVRFRSGYPEKIGGWAAISYSMFLGVCRSLWNWITLKNYNLAGVGTNLKFYIENGGVYYDITPVRETTTNLANEITLAVANGSNILTITDVNADSLQSGDYITIAGATDLGTAGTNVTAGVLNQEFQIVAVLSGTTYTVKLPVTSNRTASDSTMTTLTIAYQINTGLATYSLGTGWGAGPWPPYSEVTLTNPFATTYPANTTIVTVNHAAHGLDTGDYVTFASISDSRIGNTTSTDGIPTAVMLKAFQITKVDANSYTISTVIGTAPGPVLTYNAAATDTSAGGTVVVYYPEVGNPASYERGWGEGYTAGFGLQLRLWSQANFGENLLFNPRGGAIYIWEPGPGNIPGFGYRGVQLKNGATVPSGSGWATPVSTDVTCPDTVNQMLVSDATRIVIALGCNDPSGTLFGTEQDPLLIRWSAQENFATWTPAISNQAGSYRLSHGSVIVGALQTRQEILVWTDTAIYAMQYLGPPYIFGFTLLADNVSIISPNAMATANGITYWMGTDKFYVYSGRVETLPCSLRTYVYDDINRNQGYQFFAGTNEGYSEIWWFYCSANSDVIDRYVIFNYLDRVWYYGTLNRTAWLDSPLRQYPMAANGVEMSTLASAVSQTATSLPVATSLSYPKSGIVLIDSEQIAYADNNGTTLTGCIRGVNGTTVTTHAAGAPVVAVGQNLLLFHEAAVDDGTTNPPSPISAYVQSSDFDIGDGHNYGFVWQIIPDITFDGSNTSGESTDKPQVNFTVRPRQNPGSNYGVANMPTVQSRQSYAQQQVYNVQEFTEIVYTRIRGRQMAFKVSSDTLGTRWQLGTPRINLRPDGRR